MITANVTALDRFIVWQLANRDRPYEPPPPPAVARVPLLFRKLRAATDSMNKKAPNRPLERPSGDAFRRVPPRARCL